MRSAEPAVCSDFRYDFTLKASSKRFIEMRFSGESKTISLVKRIKNEVFIIRKFYEGFYRTHRQTDKRVY